MFDDLNVVLKEQTQKYIEHMFTYMLVLLRDATWMPSGPFDHPLDTPMHVTVSTRLGLWFAEAPKRSVWG